MCCCRKVKISLPPNRCCAESSLWTPITRRPDITWDCSCSSPGDFLSDTRDKQGRMSPEEHFNLGVQLASAGRRNEALAQYRQVLRRWPGHAEACTNLGVGLAEQGR